MCDRFIKKFTNQVVNKLEKNKWLWIYRYPGIYDRALLLIEADSLESAILKLKDEKYVKHFLRKHEYNGLDDLSYILNFKHKLKVDNDISFKLINLNEIENI